MNLLVFFLLRGHFYFFFKLHTVHLTWVLYRFMAISLIIEIGTHRCSIYWICHFLFWFVVYNLFLWIGIGMIEIVALSQSALFFCRDFYLLLLFSLNFDGLWRNRVHRVRFDLILESFSRTLGFKLIKLSSRLYNVTFLQIFLVMSISLFPLLEIPFLRNRCILEGSNFDIYQLLILQIMLLYIAIVGRLWLPILIIAMVDSKWEFVVPFLMKLRSNPYTVDFY